MIHLKMLLKAIQIVLKSLLIAVLIILLLIAYLQYADSAYKEQTGYISHIEHIKKENNK